MKVPGRHAGLLGQLLDTQVTVHVLLDPFVQRLEGPGRVGGLLLQAVAELGLPARPFGVHDQPASQVDRDLVTELSFDERQRKIDPGRDAGRRPYATVFDENRISFYVDRRVSSLQFGAICPMCHGATSVEQAGLGEQERTGARGCDDRCAGQVATQPGDERIIVDGGEYAGAARDENDIGWPYTDSVEPGRRQLDPAVGPDGPAGARHEPWRKTRGAPGRPGVPEHLHGPGDIQQLRPRIDDMQDAPASATMERHVIAWLLDRLGFPPQATGNFTSGGSEANATALLVALIRKYPSFAEEGLAGIASPPRFYASADSHLAWIKIARAAGLGTRSVRLVPTDGNGRLDPRALRSMIVEDEATRHTPFMIAATAGTTNAGEIDPLHDCRAIANEFGLHLHIDAAWAGALIVDDERKPLLDGIADADSVTIDAHKWLAVPMGAGMIFVRDTAAVASAFAVSTGYMPAGDGVDAYITTSQWSRRFIGLRLWMMLRASGPEGYSEMFTRHFEAAATLRARLPEAGWSIRNRSALPVILFEDAVSGIASRDIADELERDGQTWLGCVEYEGRTLLRACLTSFLTSQHDLERLIDRLAAVRARLN